MATLRVDEQCRALRDGKYALATVVRMNKKTGLVCFNDGKQMTLPLHALWKQKIKRHTSFRCDTYKPHKRLGRFRRPIAIVPTRFTPGQTLGDFRAMLGESKYRTFGVFLFNDNARQWEIAGLHPSEPQSAGGGNAVARTVQHLGDAIGMPTGPFASLDQNWNIRLSPDESVSKEHSAKEIIDEAFNRTVRFFLDHPEKDTLYYSVNPSAPSTCTEIGLGIFANLVGRDVVEEITKKIYEIPAAVTVARRLGSVP